MTCSITFKGEICSAITLRMLKCHTAVDESRLWYSALIPPPLLLLPSWVSLSQINLSRLLYWQAQRRIWQGKPVTYKPRVELPFLAVFRSLLTGTAVDGDIFWNLRQEGSMLRGQIPGNFCSRLTPTTTLMENFIVKYCPKAKCRKRQFLCCRPFFPAS